MKKLKSILLRLAELEGNLDEELARLALLRSQGKLQWSGGKMLGIGRGGKATIRLKIDSFRSLVMNFIGDECWNWGGPLDSLGYGHLSIKCVKFLAHRFSFAVFNGREPEKFVCHRCDNPKCVNPNHLFEGTQTDNMHDCSVKGRFNDRRGELSTTHKLTDQKVREIRKSELSLKKLALIYGVSKSAIHYVKSGGTWTHVQS